MLLCTVQLFQLDCPLNLVLNKDKRYSSSSTVQFKRKEKYKKLEWKERTNEPTKERKKRDNREQEKSLSFYLSQEYTLFGPCPSSFQWMLLYCTTHTVQQATAIAADDASMYRSIASQKKNRSRAVGNGLYVRCAASQRQQ